MTSYLVLPTVEDARKRSIEQAIGVGCDLSEGTVFWWNVIENATTGEGAVEIEDEGPYGPSWGKTGLSEDEVAALVPRDQMSADWFPPTE